jgi:S1-C subfamily serine protease
MVGADNPLGVAVRDLTDEDKDELGLAAASGVLVAAVAPDSVAEKNNLRAGDVITRINFTKIENTADFERALRKLTPGKLVTITVRRGKGIVRMTFNMP